MSKVSSFLAPRVDYSPAFDERLGELSKQDFFSSESYVNRKINLIHGLERVLTRAGRASVIVLLLAMRCQVSVRRLLATIIFEHSLGKLIDITAPTTDGG